MGARTVFSIQLGWVLVVFCLALSLRTLPGRGEAKTSQYSIRFKEDLKLSGDLKLNPNQSSAGIHFNCEFAGKPGPGSELHLFIEHSPDMDGGRSFLSITLNYGILRSLRLDESNVRRTEVIIPLPPDMLQQENEIVFAAEQFSMNGDKGKTATFIHPDSFLLIRFEPKAPPLDVQLLPFPLLDAHSYRAKRLSVLLQPQPSSETLEATALLVANFARRMSQPIELRTVRSIAGSSDPLLIVGTLQEQPQLKFFASVLPEALNAGEGVAALTFRRTTDFVPVLLITATDTIGITKAVHAVIAGNIRTAGAAARISQESGTVSYKPRQWDDHIPSSNHFTLADMNLRELRVGTEDSPLSVPLDATPDARFLNYGHTMTLAFGTPTAGTAEGRINIYLNGALLRSVEAGELSARRKATVHLRIPKPILQSRNTLNIAWKGTGDSRQGEFWLLPTSEFDLPRDYEVTLPDLSLLRSGLFPLGLRSDLSDTIIVVPDHIGDEITNALLELSSTLGRLQPTKQLVFKVRRQSDVKSEEKTSAHWISLEITQPPKGAVGVIQESISPFNDQKYVLKIAAPSASGIAAIVRTLFTEGTLRELQGDTAYVYPDRVAYFKLLPDRKIKEQSYFRHLQAWLREHWVALPVILAAVSGLLFIALRLALMQYRGRRVMPLRGAS